MWVYGDGARRLTVSEAAGEVEQALADAAGTQGLSRHAALTAALIAAGELWQGLADADDPAQTAASDWTHAIAEAVVASWRGNSVEASARPDSLDGTRELELRRPEGYAFYALYPETYAEAAARSGLPRNARVVGLRSIGTSLAAAVAAALDAPSAMTARPTGDPFARTVDDAALEAAVAGATEATWAIVDEGPGLSGSSFGAVADALEQSGVARERMVVFPSHAGDLGSQASEAHRRRWSEVRRVHVGFDEAILPRLEGWIAEVVGPLTAPLADFSGGAWRERVYASENAWAPVNAAMERRKFLATTAGGAWLAKFVGLGRYGEAALRRARAVHAAGFGAETAGLAHGFLLTRWDDALTPLAEGEAPPPGVLADYLRLRAGLPAGADSGASLEDLLRMGRRNTALGLGPEAAAAWDRFADAAARLSLRRVQTDDRLQPWEWLRAPDGRMVKADATDHCAAHDLIGCQDIAWDVAGALSEFDLDADAADRLRRDVGVEAELLAFMSPAFDAFQLGWWTLAAEAQAGWPAERVRLSRRVERHRARLAAWLESL